jgi:outer membrane autotransporter protein
VTGTTQINGGTVNVLAGMGNYAPEMEYLIIDAAGGRSGEFDGVNTNLAFLTPTIDYGDDFVMLVLTRNDISFTDVGGTFNQRSTGGGIETIGIGNILWDTTVQLEAPTARGFFDQLSGELHPSSQTALIEESRFIRSAVVDQLHGRNHGVWARAFGSWGHTNSDGNAARLSRSTGGMLAGFDGLLGGARLGVLGGYSRTSFDNNRDSGSSNNMHLGVYGGKAWSAVAIRAALANSWHDLRAERAVSLGAVVDAPTSSPDARTFQTFGELGYRITRPSVTFEPFLNLAYVSLHANGVTEDGGVAALVVGSGTTSTSFSTLGGRFESNIGSPNTQITGTLGWRHAFGDITPEMIMTLPGSNPFPVRGVPIATDAAAVDFGFERTFRTNMAFGAAYSGQFGSGVVDNDLRANFRIWF